jgi:PAS domain S-box-containing protein
MFNTTAPPASSPPALPSLRREDMLLVELHEQPMLVYELETLGILLVNDATAAKYGYSRDELLAMTIADLCHEDDLERLAENVSQVDTGIDRAGLWRIRRKDRSIVDVEITSMAILFEGRPAELVLTMDVTTMVQAERTIRERELALLSLLTSIDDIIFVLDLEERFQHVYTASPERLMAPPSVFLGKHFSEVLPPSVAMQIAQGIHDLRAGEVTTSFDYALHIEEGVSYWNARITHYTDDQVQRGFIIVVRDISVRKREEQELRDNDTLLEIVARHSLALLGAQDGDAAMHEMFEAIGSALSADRVYLFDTSPREPMTGEIYSSQLAEWVANGISSELENPQLQRLPMVAAGFGRWLLRLEEGEVVQSMVEQMSEAERAVLEPQGIRSLLLLPIHIHGQLAGMLGFDDCHANKTWSQREVTVLTLAATAVGQLMARAAAERQRTSLEAQLRHSQKMEAFGQLASGVAHDFNNLITIIHMNVSMLQSEEAHPEDYADTLRAIDSATERAANLTRQLLTFSRAQVMRMVPLLPNTAVLNTLQLLRRLLGEDIQIESQFAPNLPPVLADEDMLSQLLINLAVNARDAMSGGGRLSVILRNASKQDCARAPYPLGGGAILLRVQDTGSGIAREHLSRIFDPFFTTKEVGKGTGLGLATAFSIVAQHKGWIEVQSQIDVGTSFDIFLPTIEAMPARPAKPTQEPGEGRGTILIVEDEPALREMARRLLQRRGYRVLEAGSGPEALAIFDAQDGQIDALFTDMIMPGGMTGAECAAILLERRPQLPVIYTSGYNSELLTSGLSLEQGVNYLQKPYTSQDLQKILHHQLKQPIV